MFVNTLAQKTIEALDPAARALLKKPVTAAGTRFSFSSLDGRDTLEISASWGSDTVQIYQPRGESSYLKDRLAAFGEL